MSNSTATKAADAIFCDDMTYLAGCPEEMIGFLHISAGVSWLVFFNVVRIVASLRMLLRGLKWKKPNPPQTMLIGLFCGSLALAVGTTVRSVWWLTADHSDDEVQPPVYIQIMVPWFMYCITAPVLTNIIFMYLLFWLQVLDVKKTAYVAEYKVKVSEAIEKGLPEPAPPRPLKPLSEEKTKSMGLLVLALAKKRPKLIQRMNKVTTAIVLINMALVLAAAFLEADSAVRASVLALIWFATAITWIFAIYILLAYGYPLVILYGRKSIMQMYQINTTLMVILWVVFMIMAVSELPGIDKSFRNTWHNVTWGITIVLLVIAPMIMGKLMRLPLEAMKRKQKSKNARSAKGQVLRKQSSSGSRRFSSILAQGVNLDRIRSGSVVMPMPPTSGTDVSTSREDTTQSSS